MTDTSRTIFVVDDERNVTRAVQRDLRNIQNLMVEAFTDPGAALLAIQNHPTPVAAVIADQQMPGTTGLELLRKMRLTLPNVVRILFTGFADMELVIRAINEGEVYKFLKKPWDEYELQGVVLSAIQHHDILDENERLLKQVREQKLTLSALEREHPGITKLPPRDSSGAFIIEPPDAACARESGGSPESTRRS
jgi:FixJ family two-component response regulator